MAGALLSAAYASWKTNSYTEGIKMSITPFNTLAKEILAAVTPQGLMSPDLLKKKVAQAVSNEGLSPYQENFLLAMIAEEEIRAAAKLVFDMRRDHPENQAAADKLAKSEPVTEDGPMLLFTSEEFLMLIDRLSPKAMKRITLSSQANAAKKQPTPGAKVKDESPAPQNKKNDSTSTSKPK